MKLPKYVTSVTPFSKALALFILILFVVVFFFIGEFYGKTEFSSIDYKIAKKPVKVFSADTPETLIHRCGDIPDKAWPQKQHYDVIVGPVWSPDCRHVAWSLWESGTSYQGDDPQIITQIESNPRVLSGREGVSVYTDADGTVKKIYGPTQLNETPTLMGWQDRDTIEFAANQVKYIYTLSTGERTVADTKN